MIPSDLEWLRSNCWLSWWYCILESLTLEAPTPFPSGLPQ